MLSAWEHVKGTRLLWCLKVPFQVITNVLELPCVHDDPSVCCAANPILLDQEGSYTVRAVAVKHGAVTSPPASFVVDVEWDVLETPSFSPVLTYHFKPVNVTLFSGEGSDAIIYYTTDGSQPSVNSTMYLEPFLVTAAFTSISSICIPRAASGLKPSHVQTQLYEVLTPQIAAVQPSLGPKTGLSEVRVLLKNTPDRSRGQLQFAAAFGSTTGAAHCIANQTAATCGTILQVSYGICNGYYCEEVTLVVRTPARPLGSAAVDVTLVQATGEAMPLLSTSVYTYEDTTPMVENGYPQPAQGITTGGYVLRLRTRYLLVAASIPHTLEVLFGSSWIQTDHPVTDINDPNVASFSVMVPTNAELTAGLATLPIRIFGASSPSVYFNFTYMPDNAPRLDYIQPAEVSAIGGVTIQLGMAYFGLPIGTAVATEYNGQTLSATVVQNDAAAVQVLEFQAPFVDYSGEDQISAAVSVNHTVGGEHVKLDTHINIYSLPRLTDVSPECDGECLGVTGQSLGMTFTFDFIPAGYVPNCGGMATQQCGTSAAAVSFGGSIATSAIQSITRDRYARTVIQIQSPKFDTAGDVEVRCSHLAGRLVRLLLAYWLSCVMQVAFIFNEDTRFSPSKYVKVVSPTDPKLLPDSVAYSMLFQYADVHPEPILVLVDHLSLTSEADLMVTVDGTVLSTQAISAYSTVDTTVSFKLQCPTATTSQVGMLLPVEIANSDSGAQVEFNIQVFGTPSAKFANAVPPFWTRTEQVILSEYSWNLD